MIARDLSTEERALTFVFRGRLVQAAGVTDGGGGAGSMRRDTAGLANPRKLSELGDWRGKFV